MIFLTGKFMSSVAAAAQTNTDRNGTGQRGDEEEEEKEDEDDGGGGGDHTYPIVVADKKRRHLIDPFPLATRKRLFCADCCV